MARSGLRAPAASSSAWRSPSLTVAWRPCRQVEALEGLLHEHLGGSAPPLGAEREASSPARTAVTSDARLPSGPRSSGFAYSPLEIRRSTSRATTKSAANSRRRSKVERRCRKIRRACCRSSARALEPRARQGGDRQRRGLSPGLRDRAACALARRSTKRTVVAQRRSGAAMSAASFLVYFVKDESDLVTARLISRSAWAEPMACTGMNEEQALERLELELRTLDGRFEHLLWDEHFEIGKVVVEVRPEVFVQKRRVIGGSHPARARLRLVALTVGGSRWCAELPRAPASLQLVAFARRLEHGQRRAEANHQHGAGRRKGPLAVDFREVASEYILEWRPKLVRKKHASSPARRTPFHLERRRRRLDPSSRRGKLGLQLGEAGHAAPAALLGLPRRKPMVLLVGFSSESVRIAVGQGARAPNFRRHRSRGEPCLGHLPGPRHRRHGLSRHVGAALRGPRRRAPRGGPAAACRPPVRLHRAAHRADSSIAELMLPAMKSGEIQRHRGVPPEELERAELAAPAVVAAFQTLRLSALGPKSVARAHSRVPGAQGAPPRASVPTRCAA